MTDCYLVEHVVETAAAWLLLYAPPPVEAGPPEQSQRLLLQSLQSIKLLTFGVRVDP